MECKEPGRKADKGKGAADRRHVQVLREGDAGDDGGAGAGGHGCAHGFVSGRLAAEEHDQHRLVHTAAHLAHTETAAANAELSQTIALANGKIAAYSSFQIAIGLAFGSTR